ncbi:MAG: hypothetical protein J0G32_02800 [Alphaproteobacteria bacterium]|nr:hypothetical protein [Alphaproteobacteria bacterium]OJV12115.1 MAG: hypothetical protein BGO27_05180 [Alphaproteobacteria bacterium 33-17]
MKRKRKNDDQVSPSKKIKIDNQTSLFKTKAQNLLDLPTEILFNIFEYCDNQVSLFFTNKLIRSIALKIDKLPYISENITGVNQIVHTKNLITKLDVSNFQKHKNPVYLNKFKNLTELKLTSYNIALPAPQFHQNLKRISIYKATTFVFQTKAVIVNYFKNRYKMKYNNAEEYCNKHNEFKKLEYARIDVEHLPGEWLSTLKYVNDLKINSNSYYYIPDNIEFSTTKLSIKFPTGSRIIYQKTITAFKNIKEFSLEGNINCDDLKYILAGLPKSLKVLNVKCPYDLKNRKLDLSHFDHVDEIRIVFDSFFQRNSIIWPKSVKKIVSKCPYFKPTDNLQNLDNTRVEQLHIVSGRHGKHSAENIRLKFPNVKQIKLKIFADQMPELDNLNQFDQVILVRLQYDNLGQEELNKLKKEFMSSPEKLTIIDKSNIFDVNNSDYYLEGKLPFKIRIDPNKDYLRLVGSYFKRNKTIPINEIDFNKISNANFTNLVLNGCFQPINLFNIPKTVKKIEIYNFGADKELQPAIVNNIIYLNLDGNFECFYGNTKIEAGLETKNLLIDEDDAVFFRKFINPDLLKALYPKLESVKFRNINDFSGIDLYQLLRIVKEVEFQDCDISKINLTFNSFEEMIIENRTLPVTLPINLRSVTLNNNFLKEEFRKMHPEFSGNIEVKEKASINVSYDLDYRSLEDEAEKAFLSMI